MPRYIHKKNLASLPINNVRQYYPCVESRDKLKKERPKAMQASIKSYFEILQTCRKGIVHFPTRKLL